MNVNKDRKIDQISAELFSQAKRELPSSEVPYLFEQRMMARLRTLAPVLDPWAFWTRGLWRAAAPCMACSLLMVALLYHPTGQSTRMDLSQNLENLYLSQLDNSGLSW